MEEEQLEPLTEQEEPPEFDASLLTSSLPPPPPMTHPQVQLRESLSHLPEPPPLIQHHSQPVARSSPAHLPPMVRSRTTLVRKKPVTLPPVERPGTRGYMRSTAASQSKKTPVIESHVRAKSGRGILGWVSESDSDG